MLLIKLAGGLALITFGVRFLRKGFDRLFGAKIAVWLERVGRTPVRAMAAGAVTGAVAPSSTGLSVLINHILSGGGIRTDRMLAILLGANIGLTLLANIVAFDAGAYAGLLLFTGVIGFQFCRREKVRGIGQCLLAFGFIFLAMNFLSEAAMGLGANRDVGIVFEVLDRYPVLLCVSAAALGVLLQSSTATVGLGIGLAQGGVLPFSAFMPWIVGTNLGLGITSLIVSWPGLEGRRLGFANLMAKGVVAVPLMLFGATLSLWGERSGLPLSNQLALSHTAFNVAAALAALPFLNPFLSAARAWFVPEPPLPAATAATRASFLDPAALSNPAVALVQATREVLRMGDEVQAMLEHLWEARSHGNWREAAATALRDDAIDNLNQRITLYLSQIDQRGEGFDARWHFTLLNFAGELESVGDIVEKNLSVVVARQVKHLWVFTDEEEESLTMLYQKTMQQFERTVALITTRDVALARQLIATKEEIAAWYLVQKRFHYERLQPDRQLLDSTLCYLDLIDGLRRVSSHLATVAYAFTPATSETAGAGS